MAEGIARFRARRERTRLGVNQRVGIHRSLCLIERFHLPEAGTLSKAGGCPLTGEVYQLKATSNSENGL
jgi:hypothetical protein